MSIGEEVAIGELCRVCLLPLYGDPPGHTRVCEECYEDELYDETLDEWEAEPAKLHGGDHA